MELIVISFQHAMREVLGREVSREEAIAYVGRPLREQMVVFSPERADELVASYREFNHREHDRMLRLYDGILHLLDGLQRAGVKVGLVTSKSRYTTQMAFDLTGIESYFDATICADESPRQQALSGPDPPLPGAAGSRARGGCVRGRQPGGHPGGPRGRRGGHSSDLGRVRHSTL